MEIIGFLKGAGLPGGESFTNDTDMYIIWHFSSEEGEEKIYISKCLSTRLHINLQDFVEHAFDTCNTDKILGLSQTEVEACEVILYISKHWIQERNMSNHFLGYVHRAAAKGRNRA